MVTENCVAKPSTDEAEGVQRTGCGRCYRPQVDILEQADELIPYSDHVHVRFTNWVAQQENTGRAFTHTQMRWLEMIRDHVAQSLEIDVDDFQYTPFVEEGGLGKAVQVFGQELRPLIGELNEVLAV